jgi:hypothetical protein
MRPTSKPARASDTVLHYTDGDRRPPATVRRLYDLWRAQQQPPIPQRYGYRACTFFTAPLLRNGRESEADPGSRERGEHR